MTYLARELIAASPTEPGRKRIFIGLLCATCFCLCAALLLFLILPWLVAESGYLRVVSLSAGILGITILAWLCLALVFHIYTGIKLPYISGIRHVMIRIFLPLMEIVGKAFGLEKNLVRRSFIKVNNEFALANCPSVTSGQLLILLPHCIQATSCHRRLSITLNNCAHCGQCQVGALADMAKKRGCRIAIASGGTIARKIIVEQRPSFIIAIACERDLTSGIQDSYPIPVFGILNERPLGPCQDTRAPMHRLEQALDYILTRVEPDRQYSSATSPRPEQPEGK